MSVRLAEPMVRGPWCTEARGSLAQTPESRSFRPPVGDTTYWERRLTRRGRRGYLRALADRMAV